MKNYPTAHIDASPKDFADTVLMPGDPLRAKFIAENMMTDSHLINNVRGIHGYTGLYKGKKVSVMASGMGMPSIGIYSYELYNFFDVKNIIRVGSAGAIDENLRLYDIVLAIGASTNSAYQNQFGLNGIFSPTCSYHLLKTADNVLTSMNKNFFVGNVLSSDTFYTEEKDQVAKWSKMGIKCIEMETAALYTNALRAGKNALSILTISDHLITGEETTSKQRETAFTDMITTALETAVLSEEQN